MASFISTTLTTTGSVVLTKRPSDTFVRISLTGSFSGTTADLSASLLGGATSPAYAPIAAIDESTYADLSTATLISSASTQKIFQLNGAGLQAIKVNVSALSGTSITVTMYSDDHGKLTNIAGG